MRKREGRASRSFTEKFFFTKFLRNYLINSINFFYYLFPVVLSILLSHFSFFLIFLIIYFQLFFQFFSFIFLFFFNFFDYLFPVVFSILLFHFFLFFHLIILSLFPFPLTPCFHPVSLSYLSYFFSLIFTQFNYFCNLFNISYQFIFISLFLARVLDLFCSPHF